jgi:hypothetical protein
MALDRAIAVAIALKRRRRDGHEVRVRVVGQEHGAPALALLAVEERAPERATLPEHLAPEERLDRRSAEARRGAGPEQLVEQVGRVAHAEAGVERHARPPERAEGGVHRREDALLLVSRRRTRARRGRGLDGHVSPPDTRETR